MMGTGDCREDLCVYGVLQAGLTPAHHVGHSGDSPIVLAIRHCRTITLTPGILCMYRGTTKFSYNPPCPVFLSGQAGLSGGFQMRAGGFSWRTKPKQNILFESFSAAFTKKSLKYET